MKMKTNHVKGTRPPRKSRLGIMKIFEMLLWGFFTFLSIVFFWNFLWILTYK